MNTESLAKLEQMRWHRVRLSLAPQFYLGRTTPALIVLNALLKSVKFGGAERSDIRRAWHVPAEPAHVPAEPAHVPAEPAHVLRRHPGEPLELHVLFFGASDEAVAAWLTALSDYVTHQDKARFDLCEPPAIRLENGARWVEPADPLDRPGPAELEFLTPLPFKRPPGAPRTHLTLEQFLQPLARRAKNLFGWAPPLPDASHGELLSIWWNYRELRHASKSQPGHTQYFNGCMGSIYFSGDIEPLLPWLRMAADIHAGGSLVLNPSGYCLLHQPPRPLLDPMMSKASTWQTALEQVQESHDDWAAWLTPREGVPFEPGTFCQHLAERLTLGTWQHAPTVVFKVPKRDGGSRRLEKLALDELVLHTGLYRLLHGPLDQVLEPACVGYRPGRSVQTALARVAELLGQGYRCAVQSDILDFFPSVDLQRMRQLLERYLPPGDTILRERLKAILGTPYLEDGLVHPRRQGLAQGSPLSTLLANLYLDHFDETLSGGDAQLVRYADDFLILTRTREQAAALLDQARVELAGMHLALRQGATAIHDVETGFRFLGQPFGGMAEETLPRTPVAPARKTAYITRPGCFLGQNGEALEIRHDGKPLEILPLRRIGSLIVLAQAGFSSGLVQKCAALGIPLVFTLDSGYHTATLLPATRRHHGVAAAQSMHYARLTPTERLVLAKGFAAAKIENAKVLIASRYRAGAAELLGKLDATLAGIEQATHTNAIRGLEGHAAELVFRTLNSYIKAPEFNFTRRDRRSPDPMNGLFNFGYYLLFTRLNTLVRAAGLNPYLGFLHDGDDDYESLVCDIEELFRAPVDRMLLSLVNLRVIRAKDFRQTAAGPRLRSDAVSRFLLHFEDMLQADVGGVTLLGAMETQVEAFRRYVVEDQPLWFYRYRGSPEPLPPGNDPHDEAATDAEEAP